VVALGQGVTRWKLGDKVMALVVGGGYAQYCPAHESHCLPVPAGLSMVEAAAVPETFFTVWYNTFERGKLKAGETLLVHGGSSGIGTAAIQLAKAAGARVITTAGTAEKCEACKKLGADVAVNYKSEDFVAATKAATAGKGADVILDMVGGDYVERNYEAAAVEGRVVQIAFQGSYKATVDFRRLMLKRLTHTGSTLRARSVPDKGAIARGVEAHALPLIAADRVKPVIDSTFPLAQAAAAHARMESSMHIGKIVLTV
jgi:NADPH2:quinone reductase